jgi:glucose-6-phosphate isomerase
MINRSDTWKKLQEHKKTLPPIKELFQDKKRAKDFSLKGPELWIDFSKNQINQETIHLLTSLAKETKLKEAIDAMFQGEKINNTEDRAVLHTALRDTAKESLILDGENIMPAIRNSLQKMEEFCFAVHNDEWLGFTDQSITDVVNIGIGGSDLGPHMVTEALKPFATKQLNIHFVSNIDPTDIVETLSRLNPETTLFVISSKTFTTEETLTNANAARDWLTDAFPNEEAIAKHFVAVSASPEKAMAFGINKENVFDFWDFVGGRYSLWSAIGLPIALSVGMNNFYDLLAGAHEMDQHFLKTPFEKNLPVMLALNGIWYRNFHHTASHGILPYSHSLNLFPSYLQQLDMESNGKHVTKEGKHVSYATGPVIWGGEGTNGQHAFHQLLHQGTDLIPLDFILVKYSETPVDQQQMRLYAHGIAQMEALLMGRESEEAYRVMPGNKPSTAIVLNELSPKALGALIALYEHKVFTQGVIWDINSFDQWGVELGKALAKNISTELISKQHGKHDSSTEQLIKNY